MTKNCFKYNHTIRAHRHMESKLKSQTKLDVFSLRQTKLEHFTIQLLLGAVTIKAFGPRVCRYTHVTASLRWWNTNGTFSDEAVSVGVVGGT